MSRVAALLVVVCCLLVPPTTAAGEVIEVAAGTTQATKEVGADGALQAEAFRFDPRFIATIATAPIGQVVRILDFPVAPGERAVVEVERYDVHAANAETWVNTGSERRRVPLSDRAHYLGRSLAYPYIGVGLSIDPDGSRLVGTTLSDRGFFSIASLADGRHEIGIDAAKRMGIEPTVRCDTPSAADVAPGQANPFIPASQALDVDRVPAETAAFLASAEPFAGLKSRAATHQVTVAFDTDVELNTKYPKANNDIADWVTATNVLYERGRSDNPPGPAMRMLKGHTEIRTAEPDPYTSTSTSTQLSEVGSHWQANFAATQRTFVMLFSGKGSACSGAGIAWVDSYCNGVNSGGSYSATQVLSSCGSAGNLNSQNNVMLMGHELIHNAGSTHTHCYNPRIDECYTGECGSGCNCNTASCPNFSGLINGIAANRGTLMSYCHVGEAPSCGSSPFIHPTVAARVGQSIDANICTSRPTSTTCVEPIGGCGGDPVLSVSATGTGTGTILSSPAGINCGATCSAGFTSGTAVTLTATATIGSTFDGWSGGGCSGTGNCQVTLTANTSVTATFTSLGGCTSSPLSCGVLTAGTTVGAPSNLSGYSCGESQPNQERVYTLTPSTSGTVTVDLTGLTTSDLDLYVLSSCSPTTCIGNSESSGQTAEQVVFAATGGVTYYVVVEDWQGAGSPYNLQATCPGDASLIFVDGFDAGNFTAWSSTAL